MITIILEAKEIPSGEIVRKVTGKNRYTLSREVIIHGEGSERRFFTPCDGCCFLCVRDQIQSIREETKLALDFPVIADAIYYLTVLKSGGMDSNEQ